MGNHASAKRSQNFTSWCCIELYTYTVIARGKFFCELYDSNNNSLKMGKKNLCIQVDNHERELSKNTLHT